MTPRRRLGFELAPPSAWGKSPRSVLPNWREVSEKVRSAGRCGICGKELAPEGLHAHEIWEYDDGARVMHLAGITAACPACRLSMHIGRAQTQGRFEEALAHYAAVNGIGMDEAEEDLEKAVAKLEERAGHLWKLEKGVERKAEACSGVPCRRSGAADGRYYAAAAYEEKGLAKQAGARWDPERRMRHFRNIGDRENRELAH